jgi:hypothetical protein
MWKRTAQNCLQRRLLTTPPPSWRKDQLDKLKRKFLEPAQIIKGDEDLQPMWQAMERRVKNRLPPRKDGKKGTSECEEDGRRCVARTRFVRSCERQHIQIGVRYLINLYC